MLVCHCYAVYSRAVDAAIAAGARSVPEIADATEAGSGCGGCHAALCQRLGARHPIDTDCGGDTCARTCALTSGRMPVAV